MRNGLLRNLAFQQLSVTQDSKRNFFVKACDRHPRGPFPSIYKNRENFCRNMNQIHGSLSHSLFITLSVSGGNVIFRNGMFALQIFSFFLLTKLIF